MIKYTNIDRKNNLVYDTENKSFAKGELIRLFTEFIGENGFKVKAWINNKKVPYELVITKNKVDYRLVVYLKNITGAGWSEKPFIKRVQVSNVRKDDIDRYIDTTDTQTFVILGYYNYDNNPLMVAWDGYRYVSHDTNRSCYVNIEHMQNGYNKGIEITNCSDQKIWVFTPDYFEVFLKNYIENNKVELL